MKKVVLIGGGGYCSGVIDSLNKMGGYQIVGITDPIKEKGTLFCNVPVLGDDSCLNDIFQSGACFAHITVGAIGDNTLREKLIKIALDIGFTLISIIDPSAKVSEFVKLGEMIYIGKNAVINSDVEIGNYCIVNTSSVVEHGCRLGDFVHAAPSSAMAGDVRIGDNTHIGINATIIQGIRIGNYCMIGAGSTILRDISSSEKVYGVVKKGHSI